MKSKYVIIWKSPIADRENAMAFDTKDSAMKTAKNGFRFHAGWSKVIDLRTGEIIHETKGKNNE